MHMFAMFKNVELPDNERALELLERVNSLWEQNSWGSVGPKSITRHRRVSYTIKEKLIDIAVNFPNALEDQLNSEVSLDQLIYWAINGDFEAQC